MDPKIDEMTSRLASALQESSEYREYKRLKEKVNENDLTKHLLSEYHELMILQQAQLLQGIRDSGTEEKMKKINEVLQFDDTAFAFLAAEYSVHSILSEIYKRIANSVEINLNMLES